ncbi:MAG: mitochondrial fission ELM1 family protein [Alphaproteobacteria bacterium]|nr:mitochondrial fission ELM1 family protein [Alphaproteobacteria bacterium]
MSVWVLADTAAGHANQALGVAEALKRPFEVKHIAYTRLAVLPNRMLGATQAGIAKETRAQLAPPWPDLVIAAGRRTAPLARWIKRQSKGATRIVQIMHPGAGAGDFDLIALPLHDSHAAAPNQLRIVGAPHRLTRDKLAAAREEWETKLAHLPRPYLAVLVGGATHKRPFDAKTAALLADQIEALRHRLGGSLLVTGSRRTPRPAWETLAARLKDPCALFDGHGPENPYLAFLAMGDEILVTGDSVSMLSEACFTGRPVHLFAPPGFVGAKHARLHADLIAKGYALKPGADSAPFASPLPLDTASEIADAIRKLI